MDLFLVQRLNAESVNIVLGLATLHSKSLFLPSASFGQQMYYFALSPGNQIP